MTSIKKGKYDSPPQHIADKKKRIYKKAIIPRKYINYFFLIIVLSTYSISIYSIFFLFSSFYLLQIGLVLVFSILPYFIIKIAIYRWKNPRQTAFMKNTQNTLMKEKVIYKWIDYDQISPNLVLASIVSEDPLFIKHYGFDWKAIYLVNKMNKGRKKKIGASTITQQLVKNIFLWGKQSYVRKIIEAILTVFVELLLSKKRIIEIYLNIAQFSNNIFGVESASNYFYNKRSKDLTPEEATLLITALPNPKILKINEPIDLQRNRQQWLLKYMKWMDIKCLKLIEN